MARDRVLESIVMALTAISVNVSHRKCCWDQIVWNAYSLRTAFMLFVLGVGIVLLNRPQ